MESILNKVSKADIVSHPFPHIVIHNALSDDLYRKLEAEYPSTDLLTLGQEKKNNARYQISAHEGIAHPQINELWQEFTTYHVSQAFYQEVIALFGSHIRKLYPWLEKKLGKSLEEFSVGVRWRDRNADVVLDCQPGINTPVTLPSRVRGPHVDNPVELYAGLLYLKDKDDNAGGDLEIFQVKDPNFLFHGKAEIEDRYVEKIKTIQYAENTFVLFINSLHSIHGVSIRLKTNYPRRLVNIIGELHHLPTGGLFNLRREKPRFRFSWLPWRAFQ